MWEQVRIALDRFRPSAGKSKVLCQTRSGLKPFPSETLATKSTGGRGGARSTTFRFAFLQTTAAFLLGTAAFLHAQPTVPQSFGPQPIAPGVWFLLGDSSKGYSNTVIIELRDSLFVVDANYPGRAHELLAIAKQLSPKPVRYVFDTHAHGDHAYGNSVWTAAGATTIAFSGVTAEMNRWEPTRWRNSLPKRPDLQATGETDVQRPELSISGDKLVLNDGARELDMLFLGWGHTPGDGYVWLPRERILATGDAAVNGPRNKLLDADLANWPRALDRAIALNPEHVLPGHGDPGGIEILRGQQKFLLDLYAAVKAQADQGKTPANMQITLPEPDRWWFPESRPDLRQQDIETVYLELTHHAPAGSIPHEWK